MAADQNSIYESITFRRAELLRELADGRTEREAAAAMGITIYGVRSQVEQLR